jgi:hypothetical protein
LQIVHIDTGDEMRGGQHQLLLLMEALRSAGHESILLAKQTSAVLERARELGIRCYPASSRELWKRSGDAHIVHAHDAHAHTMAASASRVPFVVSRRVAFPVKRTALSRLKYGKAARYLAVSKFVAQQLEAAKIPSERIDVVYDAAPPISPGQPWSPEFPAVTLGTKDPEKGRDLIERAAAHSGIETIFSDDLPQVLKRASMFVYITRNEGLGSAALLAMQMGVPVIASAVGGLKEVLVDGVSGLYVNNEVSEIIKAMRKILANTNATRQMIAAAHARIEESFTVEHMLRGTLGSYARVFGA